MRFKPTLWLALLAVALVPALTHAQETGSIHGHAQDPANAPIANAIIQISTDGKTALYTFNTDANGDYKGSGIKPGAYVVTLLMSPEKAIDRFLNVNIKAGQDTQQDFDLSRADYLSKLPEAQRKAIEETKAKNAAAMKENQNVSKLNGMLKEARQDNTDKKYDDAANLMQQAVQMKPDAAVLWLELGTAQNGQKKYDDAVTSLKKALELDAASKKPIPAVQAAADNVLGEAYAGQNKLPDSVAAYDAAAKLEPASAGMYFTNETIVLSRSGSQADATIAAADKAIAADPTKPIPYYLKGQALISKATVDPKTSKIVAPPGTADAYKKYLELAPNGPMAQEAQQILAEIGEKINNKYSAGKKH